MQFIINDLSELDRVAKSLLQTLPDKRIFAFYGSMGAGKTTFIKAICHVLGSEDSVTSPTFTIVNEYVTDKGDSLYHFDFYRLNKVTEALDFGVEEYFDKDSYCFIEWPEIIEDLLPEDTVNVNITINEDKTRSINF